MIEGIWIDTMYYKGEHPEREINVEVCNGNVYEIGEIHNILDDLNTIIELTIHPETKMILGELQAKLECSIECL